MLLPPNVDDLKRSGLSDKTIGELGFYSADRHNVRSLLGFDASSGLVIPYPISGDEGEFCRVKPDTPPVIDRKPAKYLSPKGVRLRSYIPPRTRKALLDPDAPLVFTEGEKKAAKADQEGFACIGLGGVYAFRDRENSFLPELDDIDYQNRPVYVCQDSDMATNQNVVDATWELSWQLNKRDADVIVVVLPVSSDGSKNGLDDYLVSDGPGALKILFEAALPFSEWACERVSQMPANKRSAGLKWLAGRLLSLDPTDAELLVVGHCKTLGTTATHMRRLIRKSKRWEPNLPRAEREAAEANKAQQNRTDTDWQRPEIPVSHRYMRDISTDASNALASANAPEAILVHAWYEDSGGEPRRRWGRSRTSVFGEAQGHSRSDSRLHRDHR